MLTAGSYTGMVGTAAVSAAPAGDAPSGVDYTEYRVKTGATQGDWVKAANTGAANPFASQVTVSAEGDHTVEYRSVDKAGNVEATKSVSFTIQAPVIERSPTATATATATATPVTPGATATPTPTATPAPPAPKPTPWFTLTKPAKTTVAAFSKSGLAVRVTGTEAMSGSATITVTQDAPRSWG